MIYHGDVFDVLPTLPDDSYDSGVTDPPYGIGFMGKEWDTFKPSALDANHSSRFSQVDRSRVDHPNPNLRGRTRSPALSPSQIDYDRSLRGQRGFQEWTERWAREVFRVLKPGAHLVVCGAPRSYHRMACGIEDAGFEIRDGLQWLFGQGFPKSKNLGDGWGTALKPGYEPIVLARKPMRLSAIKNRQQRGTGGLNIEACRLDTAPPEEYRSKLECFRKERHGDDVDVTEIDLGRWPANLLLDEGAALLLDAQSGELTPGRWPTVRRAAKFGDIYEGGFNGQTVLSMRDANDGGASRFFYVAKPSREERDLGCEDLPMRSAGESTERKEGSAGLNSPRAGAGRTGGGRNFHPTVKPLALARWLVRLITPPGGRVIVPFLGSGTEGMACVAEGVAFDGIEREAEYIDIARRRIRAIAPLFADEATLITRAAVGD